MSLFIHYLLHTYALYLRPSLTELQSSPLQQYMWRSAALEKLRGGGAALRCASPCLTTGYTDKAAYAVTVL